MRKNLKRVIGVIVTAMFLLGLTGNCILAETHIDTQRNCSVTVDIPDSWSDLDRISFPVELYKVADVNQDDIYTATAEFKDMAESFRGISSKTSTDDWEKMAKSALDIVNRDNLNSSAVINVSDGKGTVFNLSTGMYLVHTKEVKTDSYSYTFVPYLVSVPNNEFLVSGAGEDKWIYDNIVIGLKPEQHMLYGSIQINKVLKTYNSSLGNPLFAFDIEAYDKDGKVVFSDIASITFGGAGSQSIVVDHMPAGSKVVGKEVYSAGSYQVTSSPEIQTEIVAEKTSSVDFTNDYNGRLIYSTGVVNHFEYDGTGWEWVQK